MADADLDVVIRKLARQQHKALSAAVKTSRDHYVALAAKAKTPEIRTQFRQLAKDAAEHGSAALKRMQISADNAADSYARAMRRATEAVKSSPVKKAKTSAKTSGKPSKR